MQLLSAPATKSHLPGSSRSGSGLGSGLEDGKGMNTKGFLQNRSAERLGYREIVKQSVLNEPQVILM